MTRLSAEALALVDNAGKEWLRHKAYLVGLEAQIRARVEAEVAVEKQRSELRVSAAMRAAREGGATKSALKAVTTKDHYSFEALLALIEPSVEVEEKSPSAELGLTVEWQGENLFITLDPSTVPTTEWDRDNDHFWSGWFEVFTRQDGKVLIDPTGDGEPQRGNGVTEWLRSDRANEERIISWVAANPAAA